MRPLRLAFVVLSFVPLSERMVLADEVPRTVPAVQYRVTEPPKEAKLSPFYKKHVAVGDLHVVSSEKVSDAALFEAAHLIREMLRDRPDVLAAMAAHPVRLAVMSPTGT